MFQSRSWIQTWLKIVACLPVLSTKHAQDNGVWVEDAQAAQTDAASSKPHSKFVLPPNSPHVVKAFQGQHRNVGAPMPTLQHQHLQSQHEIPGSAPCSPDCQVPPSISWRKSYPRYVHVGIQGLWAASTIPPAWAPSRYLLHSKS